MSFSQSLWQANYALYQDTLHLPFNQELAAGTLSRERFCHYIIQDAHYLIAYGKALAVTAAKADTAEEVIQFARAVEAAVVAERSLHEGFMRDFDISPAQFSQTPLTPVCHHYCSFLQATAWSQPYPVAVAALLPCFWIYAEVGRDILARPVSANPYQGWIDTYADEAFHTAVRAVCATVDRIAGNASASTQAAMQAAYTDAARLEWLFWDSAWNLASWPETASKTA